LCAIARVEKVGVGTQRGSSNEIELVCHDFRTLRFAFLPDNKTRKSIYETLMSHAFPLSTNLDLFAFQSKEKDNLESWSTFNTETELLRVMNNSSSEGWRISEANSSYQLCSSYPETLGVPSPVQDSALFNAAKPRNNNRLPALSWIHPRTKASLSRSAYLKTGPWNLQDDLALVHAIKNANKANPSLLILDARTLSTTLGGAAKGGVELAEDYEGVKIIGVDLPNIHTLRESQRKLLDCCFPHPSRSGFHGKVEESRWLEHRKAVLHAAGEVVEAMDRHGASVLVQCSDGWDRTPQITSLAMLLMDPFYRSLLGFSILIEKEWASFGHKFMHRLGYGSKNYSDEQRAPIFLQFLDCVFQLIQQFPCSFEFSSSLLIFIADEMYSCRFGNFLFDSEKERMVDKNVTEKTQSIWPFILSNKELFANPLYFHSAGKCDPNEMVLYPSTAARSMVLWDYFLRWAPRSRKSDITFERQEGLHSMVELLKKKINHLEVQEADPETK